MRKFHLLALLIVLFLISEVQGQVTFTKPKGEYCQTFNNSTLVFIRTENIKFNESIESALEEHWLVTPFVIIDKDRASEYADKSKFSYLGITSIAITYGI